MKSSPVFSLGLDEKDGKIEFKTKYLVSGVAYEKHLKYRELEAWATAEKVGQLATTITPKVNQGTVASMRQSLNQLTKNRAQLRAIAAAMRIIVDSCTLTYSYEYDETLSIFSYSSGIASLMRDVWRNLN